ncbi:hypothetical protein [Glutamicibacter arilaitensis]|uniref:hypothetical protein n=1 Tax=Glutamicibacter arilaitensis TaxID=256701 RepID=UPI003A90AF9B
MASSQDPSPEEAAALLSRAEQSSADSVKTTEAPTAFLLTLAFLCASIFALHGVIDDVFWYWSWAVFLPMIAGYFFWTRKRPKPRPALQHSGKYMVGIFLMIVGLQFSNFWIPQRWWFAILKFVLLFAVLTIAFWIMRRESIKSRIKDGNEQAI